MARRPEPALSVRPAYRGPVAECGRCGPSKQLRPLGLHRNRGIELVLQTKGRMTWHIEGRPVFAESGSVTFTLPWEAHAPQGHVLGTGELYFAVITLARRYERRPRELAFHRDLNLRGPLAQSLSRALLTTAERNVPASPALQWLLPRIVAETRGESALGPACVGHLAALALIELLRGIQTAVAASQQSPADGERRVRQLLARMPEQCGQPWTLEQMAEQCDLGRTQFARWFTRVTGETPMLWLNRLRVEQATALLTQTDLSVTRIAMRCGFGSSQYFARVFRQYTGLSPRACRRPEPGND